MKTNNKRTDSDVLGFISDDLKKRYDWISDVSYNDYEDYKMDLTISTVEWGDFKAEVKTSRSHSIKNDSGDWNTYYSTDSKDGILRYSLDEIPDSMKGKHVYMINASSKGEKMFDSKCKYEQMMKNRAALIYITKGGYLVWDWTRLNKSLIGFTWVKCFHTEDFKENYNKDRELKALFAFEGAAYIKTDIPDWILK